MAGDFTLRGGYPVDITEQCNCEAPCRSLYMVDGPRPAELQTGVLVRTQASKPCSPSDWVDIATLCNDAISPDCARILAENWQDLSGSWPLDLEDPHLQNAPQNSVYFVANQNLPTGVESGLMVRTRVSVPASIGDWQDACTVCDAANPIPVLLSRFTVDNAIICENGSINFTDSSLASGCNIMAWLWERSADNGTTWADVGSSQSLSLQFTAAGSYLIRHTAICDDGRLDVSPETPVTVANVSSSFTTSAAGTFNEDKSVTFTSTATGNGCEPDAWNWEISTDGLTWSSFGTEPTAVYNFAEPGNYQARLTATCTSVGCADISECVAFAVSDSIVAAAFTVDASDICAGGSVTVSDASMVTACDAVAYNYEMSQDGVSWSTISNGPQCTYAFEDAGVYQIRLTTTCSNGESSTSPVRSINVVEVVAAVSVNSIAFIEGDTAEFTDMSTVVAGDIDGWKWESSRDGGATWSEFSTAPNPAHAFADAGIYQVRLIATSSAGNCTTTSKPITVTVNAVTLTPAFTIADNTVCVGSAVQFADASMATYCNITSWTWEVSSDGGTTWSVFSSGKDASRTFMIAGSHLVRHSVACDSGQTATSEPQTVTVVSATASFTMSATSIPEGQSVLFSDTSIANGCVVDEWMWELSIDNGVSWSEFSKAKNPVQPFANPGTYTVRLTAGCAAWGCTHTSIASVLVVVDVEITASFSADRTSVCIGDFVQFTDETLATNCVLSAWNWEISTDGLTWSSFDNQQNPEFNFISAGDYQVRLTSTCDAGISHTSEPLAITAGAINASFTYPATALEGETIALANTTTSTGCTPDTWLWEQSADNGATWATFSTDMDATLPASAGPLAIRLTASCSANGCSDVSPLSVVTVDAITLSANFNTDRSMVCVGERTMFTDQSLAINCQITSHSWEISRDNGVTWLVFDTNPNAEYEYLDAGIYLIRQTVSCPAKTDTSVPTTVTVGGVATAFVPSATSITERESISFTDTSTAQNCIIDAWDWQKSEDGGTTWVTFSGEQNPVHQFDVAGSILVRLATTCGMLGCVHVSDIASINVAAVTLNPSFSAADLTVCAGSNTAFADTSTATNCVINAWDWEVSDDNGATWASFSEEQNAAYTPPNPGNYLIRLHVTCPNGQTAVSAPQALGVTQITAALTSDVTQVGQGGEVDFEDRSVGTGNCAIDGWVWEQSPDGGNTWTIFSNQQNPQHVFPDPGIYQVRLTSSCSSHGCSSVSDIRTITVLAVSVAAAFTPDDTTICAGGLVRFSDASVATNCAINQWQWEKSGDAGLTWATFASTANAQHVFTGAGDHLVRLTVACATGATHTSPPQTITAAELAADFSRNVTAIIAGGSVSLMDETTGVGCIADSWQWERSLDGGAWSTFSTVQSPALVFNEAGTHSIRVTATCSTHGCSSTSGVKTVDVAGVTVTATLVMDSDAICLGGAVAMTDTSISQNCVIAAWNWQASTNGGSTWNTFDNQQHPTYTPVVAGDYQIRLQATCAGGQTDISPATGLSVGQVTASLSAASTVVNENQTLTFTDTSTATGCNIDSWSWEQSIDGVTWTQFASTKNANYAFPSPGSYRVRLTAVCSANGCTSTSAETIITVNDVAVIASFSMDAAGICAGGSITFTDTSVGAFCTPNRWLWEVSADSGVSWTAAGTQKNIVYQFNTAGAYQARLTATCPDGTSNTSNVQGITVGQVSAGFTATTLTPVDGQAVTLTDTSTALGCTVDQLIWEISDNNGATWLPLTFSSGTTFTPPASGSYHVRLTASCTTNGCEDTFSEVIVVQGITVNASFSAAGLSACAGTGIALTDTSTAQNCAINAWNWESSTNNGVTWTTFSAAQNPTFNPPVSGAYRVRLTATCDSGQTATSTQTVLSITEVTASFTASSQSVDEQGTVLFTSTSTGVGCVPNNHTWEVSDDGGTTWAQISTVASVNYAFNLPGTYLVRLTSRCQPAGCEDTTAPTTITVAAVPPTAIIEGPGSHDGTGDVSLTVTFDKPVTGLTPGDFGVTGGTVGTLTGGPTVYTLTVTPDGSNADIGVNLPGDSAQDDNGTGNTPATLTTPIPYVDSTAPTVSITCPASHAGANSGYAVTITFSEEVTGLLATDITLQNATPGTLTTADNITFTLPVTPTSDADVSVTVPANAAQDAGGNGNAPSNTCVTSYVDSTAPTVIITGPASHDGSTPFTADATFSEDVTGLTLGEFVIANGTGSNLNP